MKLFTVGPVSMFPSTLDESAKQIPYFRNAEFSHIVLSCEAMIKRLMNVPAGGAVLLLTNSGTGAMEATILNLCNEDTYALVVNGGAFGERFESMLEIHNIKHETLKLPFEEDLTEEKLEKYAEMGVNCLLINIHETSIGKLYSSEVIKKFVRKHEILLIVDAISSFLADAYDMEDIGAAATIVSSQKALALAPGLALVALSKSAIEISLKNNYPSYYFNFKDYLNDAKRGQTPFTPAVGIIYQLHERLTGICNKGLSFELQRTENLAQLFRQLIKDLPLSIPRYKLSNCLTPIILQNKDAVELKAYLYDNYSLDVTPSGGDNLHTTLRVGHIGNLNEDDIINLVEKIKGYYKK